MDIEDLHATTQSCTLDEIRVWYKTICARQNHKVPKRVCKVRTFLVHCEHSYGHTYEVLLLFVWKLQWPWLSIEFLRYSTSLESCCPNCAQNCSRNRRWRPLCQRRTICHSKRPNCVDTSCMIHKTTSSFLVIVRARDRLCYHTSRLTYTSMSHPAISARINYANSNQLRLLFALPNDLPRVKRREYSQTTGG